MACSASAQIRFPSPTARRDKAADRAKSRRTRRPVRRSSGPISRERQPILPLASDLSELPRPRRARRRQSARGRRTANDGSDRRSLQRLRRLFLQLVLKTALDQPSNDGGCGFLGVQSEAADIGLATGAANSLVHGLDDVAAGSQIAQGQFDVRFDAPLTAASDR